MAIDFTGLPDQDESQSMGLGTPAKSSGGINFDGLPDQGPVDLKGAYRMLPKPSAEYAKVNKLSSATGLPKPLVENNIQEAERRAAEPEWDDLPPKTATMFRSDMDMFKLAKDSAKNIGLIEQTFNNLKMAATDVIDIQRSVATGLVSDVGGRTLTGLSELAGVAPRSITRLTRAVGLEKTADFLETPVPTWVSPIAGAKRVGQILTEAGEEIAPPRQSYVTDVARGTGQLIGQLGIAAYLGPSTSMAMLAGQGASIQAERMPEGERTAQQELALIYGALTTFGTEKYQLDSLLNRIPPQIRDKVAQRIADYAIAGTGEAAQEVLEGIGQDFITAKLVDPEFEMFGGLPEEASVAFTTGMIGRSIVDMMIPGRHSDFSRNQSAAQSAMNAKKDLDGMVDAALDADLRAADQDAFAEAVKRVTDEDMDISITAEDATEFFQTNPDALEVIGKKMPAVSKAVKEAMNTGSDITIPANEYLAYLGDWHKQGLGDIIRLGEMSAKDAQQWTERQADEFKAEASRILAEKSQDEAFIKSADEVGEAIKENLIATGRFTEDVAESYATLHRAFSIAMAERLGVSPAEVYEQYGLRFRVPPSVTEPSPPPGEVAVTGGTLSQAQTPDEIAAGLMREMATDAGYEASAIESAAEAMQLQAIDPGYTPEATGIDSGLYGEFSSIIKTFQEKKSPANLALMDMALDESLNDEAVSRLINARVKTGMPDADILTAWAAGDKSVIDEIAARRAEGAKSALASIGLTNQGVTDKLGIESRELTGEEYQDAYRIFTELQAARSALAPEGGYGNTVAGARPEETWAGKTAITTKSGQPALVYRGAQTPLEAADFTAERLGYATGFAASGLGVWSTSDFDEASSYGQHVEPFYLDIRTPKVFTVGGKEDLPDFDNVQAAIDYRRYLQGQGYDGIVIDLSDIGEGYHAVAFTPESVIRPEESFFQSAQETRGAIQFPPDISAQPSIITLFENADLSTVLHESGHFFFEVMTDIAKRPDAPKHIQNDMQTLLDWVGVPDIATWSAMTIDERREYHEKFARGFEAYLFEGKAPSVELRGLFRRFKAWLTHVYKSVRGLNVSLTDEVRDVMGRILATDEQIEYARKRAAQDAMFDTIEGSGMTEAEYAAYRKVNLDAIDEAKEELLTRSMRNMKWLSHAKSKFIKKLQGEAKKERAIVTKEVTERVSNKPVYQAITFLRTGEMISPDGEQIKVERGFKLDKDAVHALFPPEELAAVDLTKLRGMTSAKEGMDIDVAAQIFGFENGDQLVKAILNEPSLKDAIAQEVDKTMLERYSDLYSPEQIEEAANEAVHNEARIKFLSIEEKAIAKIVGKPSINAAAAKEYALEVMASLTLKEVKPKKYLAAEERAGKAADKARAKGDTEATARHKQSQMLNGRLFITASDTLEEIEKAHAYLKKFAKPGVRKGLRGDFLEQLDSLLARFDLRKAPPDAPQTPLADWVKEESDRLQAVEPDIDPAIANPAYRKHYKDLTVDELRGLRDTVKQLEFMARREEKMYQERRKLSFAQEEAAILAEIEAAHGEAFEDGIPKKYKKGIKPLVSEYWGKFKSSFDAQMLNVENMLDILTLGKGDQIFDSLFARLSEAADAQTRMMKDIGEFLEPYTKVYSIKERAGFSSFASRIYVPEVGQYLTRDQRVAVALFYGSLDGRQRLADGNGYSDSQALAIIRTLSDKDLDFIEAFWRMSDEKIWPELEALDKRTKGVSAKKVQSAGFAVNGREMRGGYVPLVYDGDLSTRAFDINIDNAYEELKGGKGTTATTRQSASKERLEQVKRPLELSLAGMASKINETVHDITHREAVTDTYRLLKTESIGDAVRSIAGPDVYKALLGKVRESAVKPIVPRGAVEKFLWFMRKNTLINMMGASFNTFAINILGVSPLMGRVGPGRYLRAVSRFAGSDMKKRYEWALEKSPYLKQRIDGFDRDLNTEINRFTGRESIMPDMATWFTLLSVMDRMVTVPGWIAAYEKGMADSNNNEELAVQYADRVIRQTQGSGRPIDIPSIAGGVGPGGEFKKAITIYYNFFSAQLGGMVRSQRLAADDWGKGRRTKAAMGLTVSTMSIIVIPAILEAIARGKCGEDPDAADYATCGFRESVFFASGMFPLLRDLVPYTWGTIDPEVPAYGVRLSPIESSMESIGKLPKSVVDSIMGEGDAVDVRNIARGTGALFGLPGFQTGRTIDGYQMFMDGETDNPMVMLTGELK